jgi:uncharacterized membrane protein SpoIIM required for sporulation
MKVMNLLNFSFWKNATNRQKRLYSIVAVLGLAVLVMAIGSLVPLSPQEAAQLSNEFNQTVAGKTTDPVFIFQNNFTITLLMFIPLVGPALGLIILFETGLVGGALVVAQGFPSYFELVLLASPHFWLEFVAYAIAMAESVWLVRRALQAFHARQLAILKNELKWLGIFIVTCVGLLAVGAIVEVWLITTLS